MLLPAYGHRVVHNLSPPWLCEIDVLHLVHIREHAGYGQRRHIVHLADDGLVGVVPGVYKGFHTGQDVIVSARYNCQGKIVGILDVGLPLIQRVVDFFARGFLREQIVRVPCSAVNARVEGECFPGKVPFRQIRGVPGGLRFGLRLRCGFRRSFHGFLACFSGTGGTGDSSKKQCEDECRDMVLFHIVLLFFLPIISCSGFFISNYSIKRHGLSMTICLFCTIYRFFYTYIPYDSTTLHL